MKLKLSDAAIEARREYYRKYRAAHPEKCAEYRRRWFEKMAQKANAENDHKTEE